MGLCIAIAVNETCTINDDISCADVNDFTDPGIALLYEEMFNISNSSIGPNITSYLPPPVAQKKIIARNIS